MLALTLLQPVPQALPDAAPVDAVALANGAAPAAAAHADKGLDILGLVLHASLPVQFVLLLLLLASISSWVIILRKKRLLDRAEREADQFEGAFWSGTELSRLYAAATERNRDIEGLEAIFESGMREFNRISQRRGVDSRMQVEGAQRGMRATT
ncbi:MAG: protein TolQ, partial [Thermomonas sp.]|nr:protein TolQ [Thermomonas sp.]